MGAGHADERIPLLLQTPAAVRWISYEPALGPANLQLFGPCGSSGGSCLDNSCRTKIDWVVAGGESGPGARPAHPDWFRSVRDQCQAAGVPFFMKQIIERGKKIPFEAFPPDLQVREYPA